MADNTTSFFCVWRNKDDAIIAIDESARECARLMGITRQKFYTYVNNPCKKWTIIRSESIRSVKMQ